LASLETYKVRSYYIGDHIPGDALPLGSASTLTILDLECSVSQIFSLEKFTNLDTLRYFIPPEDPMRDSFVEVLASCPSNLCSLETQFILRDSEDVAAWAEYQSSIFILPALQHLRKLDLDIRTPTDELEDFDGSDTYVELCMDVLDELAGNLVSLENLSICAGLDTRCLEPLGNLKMLEWIVYTTNALRGVSIRSDLTLCIPTWFQEFVEKLECTCCY
jgi:hypothetical protein